MVQDFSEKFMQHEERKKNIPRSKVDRSRSMHGQPGENAANGSAWDNHHAQARAMRLWDPIADPER
jgi:hypothetical protein